MKEKERLDVLLTERGFFESREKAKAAVMAGLVFVKDRRVDKAGTKIEIHGDLILKDYKHIPIASLNDDLQY